MKDFVSTIVHNDLNVCVTSEVMLEKETVQKRLKDREINFNESR